ncbi:hypothetical protein J2Z65_003387 [Paenibacillus aceris]|uniref:Uncharacterized protein n=1 Tax=Paenibacillus aceris TaxID=869555 RepID=A0ABS4I1Z4_9BACL|nr:hypothetical protein [Paenibacillus aceris]
MLKYGYLLRSILLLKNSVRSLLFHTFICFKTILIILGFEFKISNELGLVNIFLYYLFGRFFLTKLTDWKKEISSILPVFIVGLIF